MQLKMIRGLLAGCLLAFALAVSALAANQGAAEVTADYLNFRDTPSTEGGILDAAPKGTVVLVQETTSGWSRVLWDGREGYMSSRYLSDLTEAKLSLGGGTLTGDAVRLRQTPGLDAAVLRYLYRGDRVTVTGAAGAWYRVEKDGSVGYLYSDYVTLDATVQARDAKETVETVVSEAKDYLDIKYQWGGTSPSEGFDCSGLVYYCFVDSGLSMNRTASTQYQQGSSVERDSLVRGDLVFFASPSGWNISHVGIYLGEDQFIHASSGAGKVTISQLSSWYYDTYYYGARRLLS